MMAAASPPARVRLLFDVQKPVLEMEFLAHKDSSEHYLYVTMLVPIRDEKHETPIKITLL